MASEIYVNTSKILEVVNSLNSKKSYYGSNKYGFSSGAYGSSGSLSSALAKIGNNYNKISSNINTIKSFLTNYYKDIEGVENKFSGNSGYIIDDGTSSIASKYASSMIDYEVPDEKLFDINTVAASESSASVTSSGSSGVLNSIGTALLRTGATIGTGVVSVVEGVAEIGELAVDAIAIAGSAVATIETAMYDAGAFIGSVITGKEFNSVTADLWSNTMSFVSKDHVESVFDSFYENNSVGQFLMNNAYFGETVRTAVSTVSEVAGVVALTVATLGAAGVIGGTTEVATVAGTELATVSAGTTTASGVLGSLSSIPIAEWFLGTGMASWGIGTVLGNYLSTDASTVEVADTTLASMLDEDYIDVEEAVSDTTSSVVDLEINPMASARELASIASFIEENSEEVATATYPSIGEGYDLTSIEYGTRTAKDSINSTNEVHLLTEKYEDAYIKWFKLEDGTTYTGTIEDLVEQGVDLSTVAARVQNANGQDLAWMNVQDIVDALSDGTTTVTSAAVTAKTLSELNALYKEMNKQEINLEEVEDSGLTMEEIQSQLYERARESAGHTTGTSAGGRTNRVESSDESGILSKIGNVLNRTAATVGVVSASVAEGTLSVGELAVDAAALVGTAVATVPTLVVDAVTYGVSSLTNTEWNSLTSELWSNTMSFVSTDYSSNLFDSFYENNPIYSWIENNAYGFDMIRTGVSTITEFAGVVALTVFTLGATGVIGGATVGASEIATVGTTAGVSSAAGITGSSGLAIAAESAALSVGTEAALSTGATVLGIDTTTAGSTAGLSAVAGASSSLLGYTVYMPYVEAMLAGGASVVGIVSSIFGNSSESSDEEILVESNRTSVKLGSSVGSNVEETVSNRTSVKLGSSVGGNIEEVQELASNRTSTKLGSSVGSNIEETVSNRTSVKLGSSVGGNIEEVEELASNRTSTKLGSSVGSNIEETVSNRTSVKAGSSVGINTEEVEVLESQKELTIADILRLNNWTSSGVLPSTVLTSESLSDVSKYSVVDGDAYFTNVSGSYLQSLGYSISDTDTVNVLITTDGNVIYQILKNGYFSSIIENGVEVVNIASSKINASSLVKTDTGYELYDENGLLAGTVVVSALDGNTVTKYNTDGSLAQITYGDGSYEIYGSKGYVTTRVDAEGNTIMYSADGVIHQINYVDGTTAVYDNGVLSYTQSGSAGNEYIVYYYYDTKGVLAYTVDSLNKYTFYDTEGNTLYSYSTENNYVTSFSIGNTSIDLSEYGINARNLTYEDGTYSFYNADGLLVGTIDSSNTISTYYSDGTIQTVTTSDGTVTSYTAEGLISKVVTDAGLKQTYTYEEDGSYRVVDNVGNKALYTSTGIKVAEYLVSTGTTTTYDTKGNVLTTELTTDLSIDEMTVASLLPSNEVLQAQILEEYGLTESQFNTLVAIVSAETSGTYEDAHAVISCIYNRSQSQSYVDDFGSSIYSQATAANQFVVYQNGSYKQYISDPKENAYQAVIDVLSNPDEADDYLDFLSKGSNPSFNYTQVSEGGNKFSTDRLASDETPVSSD